MAVRLLTTPVPPLPQHEEGEEPITTVCFCIGDNLQTGKTVLDISSNFFKEKDIDNQNLIRVLGRRISV